MPVRILFIGDVVGKPGRDALSRELHRLVDRYCADLVIVNGENAAGGFGLTEEIAREIFSCGVHVITSGNHIWDKREIYGYLENEPRLLRPVNYPEGAPGSGSTIVETAGGIRIAVLNVEGRIFMNNLECPFRAAQREIARLKKESAVVFVDFHAEATSEKIAFAWHLDGMATAVVGTHTHVQTADERILSAGTAFISDAGMTGSFDSVIGIRKEEAIQKFLSQMPAKFEVAKKDVRISGIAVEADTETGRALSITRFCNPCC